MVKRKRNAGHGGRRPGAGRKSPLTFREAILIGSLYDLVWNALAEKHLGRKIREVLPYADIKESRAFLLKNRRVISDNDEHLKWLAETLDGRRVFHAKTPQGYRKAVLDRIAREESRRLGISISVRQVARCLSRYRAFVRTESET